MDRTNHVEPASDQELVAQFRQGNQTAATILYNRHVHRLLGRIRRTLSSVPSRGAHDSEGIVLSGFATFFSAVQKPDFNPFQWNVAALLTVMTVRKCARDLRRKQLTRGFDTEDLHAIVEGLLASAADNNSVQEFEAQFNELVAQTVAEMTDLERAIVIRALDETSVLTREDIANDCNCSLDRVESILKDFERRLQARWRKRNKTD